MKPLFKRSLSFLFVASILFGVFFFLPHVFAQNQDTFGTQVVNDTTVLGSTDIRTTIARIIRVVLGLLGIIAVSLIVYGGFVYMTAGGNEEKVGQAKKILINSTIGLVIILSAFAITQFVLNSLGKATGVAGLENAPIDCQNLEVANDPAAAARCQRDWAGDRQIDPELECFNEKMAVRSITPSTPTQNGSTNINNAKVRMLFSGAINTNDPAKVFRIFAVEGSDLRNITGSFRFSFLDEDPALVQAVYQGENGAETLPKGTYRVQLNDEVKGANNQEIAERLPCGDFPTQTTFQVTTENISDNAVPDFRVTVDNHDAEQVDQLGRGATHVVRVRATDNAGISYVQYRLALEENGREQVLLEHYSAPSAKRGSQATNEEAFQGMYSPFFPANLKLGHYILLVSSYDIDGQKTDKRFDFAVVEKGCKPGDEGEGCLQNNQCRGNWECASHNCQNGQCVASPLINKVTHWDGAEGNYITIEGKYFGGQPGKVEFIYDKDGGGTESVVAAFPQCGARNTWTDEFVIVQVPGAPLPAGKPTVIKVTRAGDQALFDTTNDDRGVKGKFTKNDVKRPKLCSVSVAPGQQIREGAIAAPPKTQIQLAGSSFGASEKGKILLGAVQGESLQWGEEQARSNVPANMQPGLISVQVVSDGQESNSVPFRVENSDAQKLPLIKNVDPDQLTPRSLFTVSGENFGSKSGVVFLAKNKGANCRPQNGVIDNDTCKQASIDFADQLKCGDTWTSNQIVARVPQDLNPGNWFVIIERQGDRATSQGEIMLNVVAGEPRPGICALTPNQGPAPLSPDSQGLLLSGVNFGENPQVLFWWKNAAADNADSWLKAEGNLLRRENAQNDTPLRVKIPVTNDGTTILSGPVKLKAANGQMSNSVNYTVNDCTKAGKVAGFKCCPDGHYVAENLSCPGEVRNAGYVWRFTTGRIAQTTEVAEECADEGGIFPSPTPQQSQLLSQGACLNATVAVRFKGPEEAKIVPQTINSNTVRVYKCATDGDGKSDCAGNKKQSVPANQLALELRGNTLVIAETRAGEATKLEANTWYRVELSKNIQTLRRLRVDGGEQEERLGIRIQRPCGGDTAYCYEFKTGNGNCQIAGAGITPPALTVNYLGMIQNPFYAFDKQEIFRPAHPYYYYVWGKGDQKCSVVNVDSFPWQWQNSDAQNNREPRAQIVKAPNERYQNSRATVTAISNTAPESITLQASSVVEGVNLRATSDLTVELGEVTVEDIWPNCSESCTNAEIGVRFSRQVMQDDHSFEEGFKVFKCADAVCNVLLGQVPVQKKYSDYFRYIVQPIGDLEVDTWYLVTVNDAIKGVGRLGKEGIQDDVASNKGVHPESRRFKTTKSGGRCLISSVRVEPVDYIASAIGQRTVYNAFPFSPPNSCSPFGQGLNPWGYGWEWTTSDNPEKNPQKNVVAEITQFDSTGSVATSCDVGTCKPKGSSVALSDAAASYPVCGNGIVENGEDCDIGLNDEVVGVSCTLNCLRPGNKQKGNGELQCGNGKTEKEKGEECDPGDPGQKDFCTDTCLWKGSSQTQPTERFTPWCGDGQVTRGEDCDITDNNTKLNCSDRCLHGGTKISQQWCSQNKERNLGSDLLAKNTPECRNAASICGNFILEEGEECEFVPDEDRKIDQNRLQIIGGQTVDVSDARKNCSNRCILQNLCPAQNNGTQQIPLVTFGGPRCTANTPGCKSDCTLAGSSIRNTPPSLCGDGVVGIGETVSCEIPAAAGAVKIGNPVQLVTARGQGVINNQTQRQEVDIQAKAVSYRETSGIMTALPKAIAGKGDYALQCGFTEIRPQQGGQANLLFGRDGNFEKEFFDFDSWTNFDQNGRDRNVIEKTTQEKFEGQRSVHVVVNQPGGLYMDQIPAVVGKTYRYSFHYKLVSGSLWGYTFKDNSPEVIDDTTFEANPATRSEIGFRNTPSRDWQYFERIVKIPAGIRSYGVTIYSNDLNAEYYIDDVKFEEVKDLFLLDAANDCPGDVDGNNADNTFGVASNSCCYKRTQRVSEYPVANAGIQEGAGVCLNTALHVEFDHIIEEASLKNNLVLAHGHASDYVCGENEPEITPAVQKLLVMGGENNASQGWVQELWQNVKHVFVKIIGLESTEAVGERITKWCQSDITLTPKVQYNDLAGADSHTVVSITLSKALMPNTTYAVILKGGPDGIKDSRGVGIMSPNKIEGRHVLTDMYQFHTGNSICKIDRVEVNPSSYLFTKPSASSTFVANIISNAAEQLIQSTPDYSWQLSWQPTENPLFEIPAANTPANTDHVIIAAKNLEGRLTASVLTSVTKDISQTDNQEGKVFSGNTDLSAVFCENPWPAREVYPYEDGVRFLQKRNNDNFNLQTNTFDGNPMPRVNVDGRGEYFNFSVGYCADAGRSGVTTDDLPYLQPHLFGDLESMEQGPLDPLGSDVVKKVLFTNPQNDDAIGIQIFKNYPARLTAAQWYTERFALAGENTKIRSVNVGGYDAVTDGNNYYINVLNQSKNGGVYNYIYLFSINEGAQNATRRVFEQLINSLEFNINMSDFGYCLSDQVPRIGNALPAQESDLAKLSNIACDTDFACRDSLGRAKSGTNGICSNAKTKFLRDWDRLNDVRKIQNKLEVYKNAHSGSYPTLMAGSYLPGYTNSRWGSWGTLSAALGSDAAGIEKDPLNNWSSCGVCSKGGACASDADCAGTDNKCVVQDPQTCWNPQNATFMCPLYSSVYEYSAHSASDYKLHIPLEYFSLNNPVVADFVDESRLSTEPSCHPGVPQNAVGGQCGDGVVNAQEECEPVGSVEQVPVGLGAVQFGSCAVTGEQCVKNIDCGSSVKLTLKNNVPKANYGILKGSKKYCTGPNGAAITTAVAIKSNINANYYGLYACSADIDCQKSNLYNNSNKFNLISSDVATGDTVSSLTSADLNTLLNNQRQDQPNSLFKCKDSAPNQFVAPQLQCQGAVVGALQQCGSGTALRTCNTSCKYEYGMCQNQGQCGNGRIEGNEKCDSGALNGTYGQCAGPASLDLSLSVAGRIGHPPIGQCQGPHHEYCGNGLKDGNDETCDSSPDLYFKYSKAGTSARITMNSYLRVITGDTTEAYCAGNVNCTSLGRDIRNFFEANPNLKKRCSLDKSVICSVDADCTLPSVEKALDLIRIDGSSLKAVDSRFFGSSENKGTCSEVVNAPGSPYNPYPEYACAASCKAVGNFCGDRIVQSPYEQCDDGNRNSGDGCNNFCQKEQQQAVAVNPAAPLCGNTTVDPGEVCDKGNQNGIPCNPAAGQSCIYCSAQCDQILTRDSGSFCGNGHIDLDRGEECEIKDGKVYKVWAGHENDANNLSLASCTPGEVGTVTCSNDCKSLVSSCIACGKSPLNPPDVQQPKGTRPFLAVVNVLTDQQNNAWANSMKYQLLVKKNTGLQVDYSQLLSSHVLPIVQDVVIGNDYQYGAILADNTQGIVTNSFCAAQYGVVFNNTLLRPAGLICNGADDPRCKVKDVLDQGKAGFFSYPVKGEVESVSNEVVVSPAVSPGVFRAVVRWGKDERDAGYQFYGNLFNSDFNGPNNNEAKIKNIVKAQLPGAGEWEVCKQVRFENGYWTPGESCQRFDGVAIHPFVGVFQQYAQAMTIDTTDPSIQNGKYAFFVAAQNADSVPIGNLWNKNITVDVYTSQPNQDGHYSIYQPTKSFKISESAFTSSNSGARYWHVFNLIRQADGSFQLVAPQSTETGQIFEKGAIVTGFSDVLCNVPGQPCNRDR